MLGLVLRRRPRPRPTPSIRFIPESTYSRTKGDTAPDTAVILMFDGQEWLLFFRCNKTQPNQIFTAAEIDMRAPRRGIVMPLLVRTEEILQHRSLSPPCAQWSCLKSQYIYMSRGEKMRARNERKEKEITPARLSALKEGRGSQKNKIYNPME